MCGKMSIGVSTQSTINQYWVGCGGRCTWMINTRPKRFKYIVVSNTAYDLNFRLAPRIDRKINSYVCEELVNKVPYNATLLKKIFL